MDWKILARLGCPPKFLTFLRQLHEGQQGQVKHNGSLSDSFPISNGVKQGCVLAPTLFSNFFSIMLREAKENLPRGNRFRTDGNLFNLRSLHARTKKIEELLSLSCCLLTTAPFSPTRRKPYNTWSTASLMQPRTSASPLKKTEVLYQPPPREAYSPPHISTDGTNQNAMEHFTYLDSVISNDATLRKELDNRLSEANSSSGRLSKRVTRSAFPKRSRCTGPSSFPPSCTLQRPVFSIGSRSGYWSGFTNAACAAFLASNGKTTRQTKKSSREPAYPA